MVRTRMNVWTIEKPGSADQTLHWYNLAVGEMKKKPITDPSSWRYQAAMHEYWTDVVPPETDPLATPGEAMPSAADHKKFWTQCQHGSWYFLPWHRMYLHHFEQIVMAEVVKLGGPADWALPYWNYNGDPSSRLLPPSFQKKTLPDGSGNNLWVEERNPKANAGTAFITASEVDLNSLLEPKFYNSSPSGSSFGGFVTKFEHAGGNAVGIDIVPHGAVHVAVGRGFAGPTGGWMGQFFSAALDPIFWLHHANIDRLWEVWVNRDATHKNPTTKKWRTNVSFVFHDATGAVVTMTPSEVVDTTAAPLSYQYEEISDPLAGPSPMVHMGGLGMMAAPGAGQPQGEPEDAPTPEMVGATERSFELSGATAHADVPFQAAPHALGLGAEVRAEGRRRKLLNIENLKSETRAPAYDVYVNVPQGEDPAAHPDHFAGRLPMFGLRESSHASDRHAGSGLHYVLDVTSLVERLAGDPAWDPEKLRVSFVPSGDADGHAAKVKVGRVSLYVE